MNRIRVLLLASLLAAPAAPALAEVKALVAKLRGEPMSLFDWGLFELERELQSVRRDERDFLRVLYDGDGGRVVIEATFFVFREEIEAINARRACFTRHHAIKLTLGIIDTDRLNVAPAADFRLGLKFSHRDPEQMPGQPDPAAIGEELMHGIYIKVAIVSDPEDFPFKHDMRCEGRLMSQEVFYDGSGSNDFLPD